MRKVIVYEYIAFKGKKERREIGTAIFHQFGVNYEEFESGPGNFSTAIIEFNDGTVKNIPAELISFVID